MLTRQGLNELASPNHRAKLIGTAIVTSPSSSKSTQPEQEYVTQGELDIKSEIKIKTEEDLLHLPPNVPRKVVDLRDPNVPLIIRHTDGSLCHSKKSYAFYNKAPPPRPNELPDLPDSLELNTSTRAVNTENIASASASVCAPNSVESKLRDLLDLQAPNDDEQFEKGLQDKPTSDVNTGKNTVNNVSDNTENGQVKKGPQDKPASDVNTRKNTVDNVSDSMENYPARNETIGNAIDNQELANSNNNEDRISATITNCNEEVINNANDTSPGTTSINTVSEIQETSIGTDHNSSTPSINKQVALDIADRRELHDAGLSPSHAKPIEKVYNEWITTFSDDSLFDEMTEDLKRNELTNSTGESPEQRAAEVLLLLRNQTNYDSNETLMPVDAPKLPDLVLEMDAEKDKSIKDSKTVTGNNNTALTKEKHDTANNKLKEKNSGNKDKTIDKGKQSKKIESTKSPMKGVFQMRTIGLRKHKSLTHQIVKKIGCSLCKQKFDNRKELKIHHQEDHNILTCDICGKSFSTKKSLSKHLYKHSDLPWKCKKMW